MDDGVEEAGPLDEEQPLGAGGAVGLARGAHGVEPGLEQDFGGLDRLAAPPQPHGARVTRPRRHALAECCGEQQRVRVEPVGAALALGEREAAIRRAGRDKGAPDEVELAQHRGVAAAARER